MSNSASLLLIGTRLLGAWARPLNMSILLGTRIGAYAPLPPKSARGSTPRARSARRRRNIFSLWHENRALVILPQDVPTNPRSKRWQQSPMGSSFLAAATSASPPTGASKANDHAAFEPEVLKALDALSHQGHARITSPLESPFGLPSRPPLRRSTTAPASVFNQTSMHAVKSRTDSDVADEEVAKIRRAMAAEAKARRESESRMHARANAELRRRLHDVGGRTSTTATPRRRGRGRSTMLSNTTSGGAASASTDTSPDTSSVPAASLPPTEGLSRSVVDVGRLGGNVYYGVGYVATDSLRCL